MIIIIIITFKEVAQKVINNRIEFEFIISHMDHRFLVKA